MVVTRTKKIGQILVDKLESLGMEFPAPEEGLEGIEID